MNATTRILFSAALVATASLAEYSLARAACERLDAPQSGLTYLRISGGGGVLAADDPVPPVLRYVHVGEEARWGDPLPAGECFAIPGRAEASAALLYIRYKPYRTKFGHSIQLVRDGEARGTAQSPLTIALELINPSLIVRSGPRKGRLDVDGSGAAIAATYEIYAGLAPRAQIEMLQRASGLLQDSEEQTELVRGVLERARANRLVGGAQRAERVLRDLSAAGP